MLDKATGQVYWLDEKAAIIQRKRLTGDFDTTSATLANVTDLAIPIAANQRLRLEYKGLWEVGSGVATSVGCRWAITGPSGATIVSGSANWWRGIASPQLVTMTTLGTEYTVANGPGSTVQFEWSAWAEVLASSTAGQMNLQFASETGGSQVSLITGCLVTAIIL